MSDTGDSRAGPRGTRRQAPAREKGRWLRLRVALLIATVLAISAGGLAQVRLDTGVESFLPARGPSVTALERGARSFGGDPVVVILEGHGPAQLLDREQLPRLLRLEGRLAGLDDVAVVYGPATVLNQLAIEAQQLLAAISGRRDGIQAAAVRAALARGATRARAQEAGRKAVSRFDLRYGRLLVQGMPAGLPTLRNPRFVQRVVFDPQGEPKPRWHFVVPEKDSVVVLVRPREELDQAGVDALVADVREAVADSGIDLRRATVTGVPAVTAAVASQVRQEIPLLGAIALVLVAGCFVALPWRPRRRDRLVPFVATLAGMSLVLALFGWLGRPLSLGLVAFLPILLGTGSDFPMYLTQPRQRRRVLAASVATAASFGSLAVSPLPFVRDLGLALAAGILVTVAVALVLLRSVGRDDIPGDPATGQASRSSADGRAAAPLDGWRRVATIAAVVGLAAAGWIGLGRMEVESRPDRLASGLSAIDDVRHAESVLGSSGEISIVLRGPDVLSAEALAWSRRAEDRLVASLGDRLRPILTPTRLLGFLGDDPTPEQVSAGVGLLPSYLTEAVVRADRRQSAMVFGLRLQSLDDQARLLDAVRALLPPVPEGMQADVVGLPVLAAEGYQAVSQGRYLSNVLGLGLVFVILAVMLSRRDAWLAVLAAGLATGWGLAVAWLLSVPLTPLTAALGSLTAATGSEFAVVLSSAHLLSAAALRRTVAVAGLSSAVGYLVLALSDIAMIQQFGLLLALSIALAYLAAYVVVRAFPASAGGPEVPASAAARHELGVDATQDERPEKVQPAVVRGAVR